MPPSPPDAVDCVGTGTDVECFVEGLARVSEEEDGVLGFGGIRGEGVVGVGVAGVALLLLGDGPWWP
ncbi:hypothetical protein OsJ_01816 [Oryza sativa Japonica Group]|uniref:Uncharacterized protein n=1 Tax=Oryza sativa subsp. japonica TaxID=39947 RepID=B9EWU2_ORYSJ|nr:hypothetical protein OsJ_01816 [Oryza sativa Japonica Group]